MIIKCPKTHKEYCRIDSLAYHCDDCPFCNKNICVKHRKNKKVFSQILFFILPLVVIFLLTMLFLVSVVSASYMLSFNSTKDTSIWSGTSANKNYGDFINTYHVIELSASGTTTKQGLIYFNVTGILQNSTIVSAVISLKGVAGSGNILTYELNKSWNEGNGNAQTNDNTINGSTWNSRWYNGSNWTTPGGDYNATSLNGAGDPYNSGYRNFTITNAVQRWVNLLTTNYGILLKSDYSSGNTDLDSREQGTNSNPISYIIYNYPSPILNMFPSSYGNQSSLLFNLTCNLTMLGSDSNANITGISFILTNSTGIVNQTFVDLNSSQNVSKNYTWLVNLTHDGYFNYSCGGRVKYENGLVENQTYYSPSNYSIFADTTAPIVNITYPLSTYYNLNVSKLNYTFSDLSPKSCWYTIDGGIPSGLTTAGNNFTGLSSHFGWNTWVVYCNDSFNHIGSASVTFNYKNLAICNESLQNSTGYPCGTLGSLVSLTKINSQLYKLTSNLTDLININISLTNFTNNFLIGYPNGTNHYFINGSSSNFNADIYPGLTFISSVVFVNTRVSVNNQHIGYVPSCSSNLVPYTYTYESGCSSYSGSVCSSSMFSNSYTYTLLYENYNQNVPPWAYQNISCLYRGVDMYNTTILVQAFRVAGNGGQYCSIQNKWDWYVYQYDSSFNDTSLTNSSYRGDIAYYDFPCIFAFYENPLINDSTTTNLPPSSTGASLTFDFSKPIYIILLILAFIIFLLLMYFGFYIYAGILIIMAGFVFMFSGIIWIVCFPTIIGGIAILFIPEEFSFRGKHG